MSKKQNKTFYFILIFSILFLIDHFPVSGADKSTKLEQADSLFKLQKYTESFEVYEQLLKEEKTASPQMFMKMAYIKEGLGDNSQALYYLNKYYQQTADKKAQSKMQDLAQENELQGYALSDTTFFRGIFNKYYIEANILILSIALFLGGIVMYRKFKSKSNAKPYAISMITLLIVFFWILNFEMNASRGIIIENHAYLMTGPSAGSDLVDVVTKGHRLIILDEEGIWIKVSWNGKPAYIRSSNLKKVS